MIIPIRCFSCGKLIGDLYEPYIEMTVKKGIPSEDAFKKLNISRFCCKRMIVSHINLIDEILKFPRLQ
ncbi:MAG: DNA-directed RNA polymerase subunit N [Candidatus Lokiarchaeota archaeon]|nr:DNA-directed RNA polymerase subunit N [Candidatus Lokiarchaeota archaeon]MCK4281801.1 DNA-directed RNA polymerase subunit N [Candidatus Lokiarchaeota archaeon]